DIFRGIVVEIAVVKRRWVERIEQLLQLAQVDFNSSLRGRRFVHSRVGHFFLPSRRLFSLAREPLLASRENFIARFKLRTLAMSALCETARGRAGRHNKNPDRVHVRSGPCGNEIGPRHCAARRKYYGTVEFRTRCRWQTPATAKRDCT